jgi:hypothetical protein
MTEKHIQGGQEHRPEKALRRRIGFDPDNKRQAARPAQG